MGISVKIDTLYRRWDFCVEMLFNMICVLAEVEMFKIKQINAILLLCLCVSFSL